MKARLVVAIDGPAGSGKSTAARALATALGYRHVDSGAMYRVVGLAARDGGLDTQDASALAALVDGLAFDLHEEHGRPRVLLAGRDVTDAIRAADVGAWASRVAAVPAVRARMVARQRAFGDRGGIVMEGRDIGTVVFPDADCKFFLTASAEERARRRYEEERALGGVTSLAVTQAEIAERDRRDRERACAPLRAPADAITIDTTALTPAAVVARMLGVVRARARP